MSWEQRIAIHKVLNFCQISRVSGGGGGGGGGGEGGGGGGGGVTCGRGARYSGVMYLSAPSPLVITGPTVSSSTVISSSTCHLQHFRLQPPHRATWSLITDWRSLEVWLSLRLGDILLHGAASQVLSAKFWQQLAPACTGDFTLETVHSTPLHSTPLHCTASPPWAVTTRHQHCNNIWKYFYQTVSRTMSTHVVTGDNININTIIKIKEVPLSQCPSVPVCHSAGDCTDYQTTERRAVLRGAKPSCHWVTPQCSHVRLMSARLLVITFVTNTTLQSPPRHTDSIDNQSVLQLHSSNDEFVSSCNILLLFSGNLSPEIY